ncbi:MAG: 4-(cytidine 5'-diphospho)-2-C-methyl-D-erythritol kinase [Alistipes sp.]|nr:4-(cytidine 5'-diphospho)-2-C-methyl-D-erythritol kinase [Alistipes sp.]
MAEVKAYPKINLGLRVMRYRPDGYHDIATVMIPLGGFHDTVTVKALPGSAAIPAGMVGGFIDPLTSTPLPCPAPRQVFPAGSVLEVSGPLAGSLADCQPEDNICMRALRLVQCEYGIGEAVIRLDKTIPTGAGLGGGSADAAAVMRALNDEFVLELSGAELERLAARLGSDVPFFVRGGAQLCTGRGEIMTSVEVSVSDWLWLVVVKPPVAVLTAEAYAGVTPYDGGPSLVEILQRPVGQWRGKLVNDLETSIFARHPQIAAIKNALYDAGALYASMSGSGSALYGIFEHRPEGIAQIPGVFTHIERFSA